MMANEVAAGLSSTDACRIKAEFEKEVGEVWLLFQEAKYLLGEARKHFQPNEFRGPVYTRAALVYAVFALEAWLRLLFKPRFFRASKKAGYDQFSSMTDAVKFAYKLQFSRLPDPKSQWWQDLCRAIDLRNKLAHPAPDDAKRELSPKDAESALRECLRFVGFFLSGKGGKPPDWTMNLDCELAAVELSARIRAFGG